MVRYGKDFDLFLMQRGFVKSITTPGRESIALIIEVPIPLEHGKGAWRLAMVPDPYPSHGL